MPTIAETSFVAIDFESAGSSAGYTDAPIQVGTACWSYQLGTFNIWGSYIFTDKPITWAAQKIHHINKEDLRDAPSLNHLWPELKQQLSNRFLVAHGHGTEKRFLRAFPMHGFGPWIDTLQMARAAFPSLTDFSLSALCESLTLQEKVEKLVPNRQWHDAEFDAVASLILLEHIIAKFSLEKLSVDLLLQPDTRQWFSNNKII